MRSFYLLPCIVLCSLMSYSQKSVSSFVLNNPSPEYSLLPVPQQVNLSSKSFLLNNDWFIEMGSNVLNNDPAVLSLMTELNERFGLNIKPDKAVKQRAGGKYNIRLVIKPGSVSIGQAADTNRTALIKQAYQLKLDSREIFITANASPGLFYGVQTLLQLLKSENEKVFFPGGEIVDWPDLDLRMIYWDDAHHLERLDAMKRAIRQASYYKINAFALKLEGHFQFENAKPLVEPYAYSTAEYQQLTDYARAHHVELIPFLDAPAHISFILKHPEYTGLRAFPNSNYQLDVTNPKAEELIMGMFDNLIDANRGGKYIFFSTDEAYYVGMSENEKKRAGLIGGNGKLLAEYITRISNKLKQKGRTVIIWGEYPLTVSDVSKLPSHLINGINGNSKEFGSKFKEQGIRHLVFTSTQGVEPLFPNYYKLPVKKDIPADNAIQLTDDELQQGDLSEGRVGELIQTINSELAAGQSDFMGVVVCGWGDAGLHPETFWLGYATGNAVAWNKNSINSQELTERFFNAFYGKKTVKMDKVYQLLSTQAEFWDKSWEWQLSHNRTGIFGYSAGIFDKPKPAKDQTLPLLPIPSATDLSLDKNWNVENAKLLQSTEKFLKENDELLNLLFENISTVDHQQYNLQVLLSVAQLCRQNLNMLSDLQRINTFLTLSSQVAHSNPSVAVSLIDQAIDQAKTIRNQRNETLKSLTATWYQDWFPRVAEANGRKYLDKVDDVKDHLPVRTVDMSYLIYRQLKLPLGKWADETINARNQFAEKNTLPMRKETLNWESTNN